MIVWFPTERLTLLNAAEPALNVPTPICEEPSRNATVPVGAPLPDCGATRAVNVMFCPLVTCVADAEREVLVPTFARAETVTDAAEDVDAEKFVSPE